MKKNVYRSQCSPKLNTRVMRAIESLVCSYREILPDGWRCCVELQRRDDKEPYYQLDLESNIGGGEMAPVKMQTLRMFPGVCATGLISLPMITDALTMADVDEDFFTRLIRLNSIDEVDKEDWDVLQQLGITHWFGGIRIPYDILVTEHRKPVMDYAEEQQDVVNALGEIRITFSGAKEWQDTFFCFQLLRHIQRILNKLWKRDQIWYNLRAFRNHPNLQFWVTNLGIKEALLDE